MGDKTDPKNLQGIKHIFENMSFGESTENLDEALSWLMARDNKIFTGNSKDSDEAITVRNAINNEPLCDVYVPNENAVQTLLKNAFLEQRATERNERCQNIYKLADEIKQQANLISQFEIMARGILSRDTKNQALPLLTEYLEFYATLLGDKVSSEFPKTPHSFSIAIVGDHNCLSSLGMILGAALALNQVIILHSDEKLAIVASFIKELVLKCVPDYKIMVISGNVDLRRYITPSTGNITIYDDIYKEKFNFPATEDSREIFQFFSPGIPLLILEDADLDSACECAINGAWSYQGMLPWSIRNVLVQENVFTKFVDKLKSKMALIRFGNAANRNAHFSVPLNWSRERAIELFSKAKKSAVEIFQPSYSLPADDAGDARGNIFKPTLLIGGNIFTNNVIDRDDSDFPVLSVNAFRTLNEAAALANNSRYGFAASIWTESTSAAHEMITKLEVGNVWVNSHALFSANITYTPLKTSGGDLFGGDHDSRLHVIPLHYFDASPSNLDFKSLEEHIISDLKKPQQLWAKLAMFERRKMLRKFLLETTVAEEIIMGNVNYGPTLMTKNNHVMSFQQPKGVIAIVLPGIGKIQCKGLLQFMIRSLLNGNSIIFIPGGTCGFEKKLESFLPKGVFTIHEYTTNVLKMVMQHHQIDTCYYVKNCLFIKHIFPELVPKKCISKLKPISHNEQAISIKTAWFNVGQSFN